MMNGKGVVRRNREVSELSLDESTGHFPNHGAGRGSWCRVPHTFASSCECVGGGASRWLGPNIYAMPAKPTHRSAR